MQYLTISNSGMLVHRKSNPFNPTFDTIGISQNLLCVFIETLHIKLNHPSKTQFKKVWHRYFFELAPDKLIDECTHTKFSHYGGTENQNWIGWIAVNTTYHKKEKQGEKEKEKEVALWSY